ncbi:YidB family protein [Methylobacterium sp. J-076]|uniref:YidB family protein n=1 Tax=Methylobacterium sp. J-076 TaxID=2836655 RepID=UPI001FB8A61E|nr:YidB family protein [Methylobacterium sp. J-076]MCJ2014104.1 YidB family protein [Methylobacterium sp. J-076]
MGMLESVIGGVLGQVFGGRQGGMSPLVKALLMLLLAKGTSGGFGDIFGQGRQGEPGPEADRSGGQPSGHHAPAPNPQGDSGDLGGFDQQGGRRDTGPSGAGASPADESLPGSGFDDLSGMLGGDGPSRGASRPAPEEAGGLGPLVDSFRQAGLGEVIGSWIGHGANHAIDPDQLARGLGGDTVAALERETGMDRGALLSELAKALPEVVHRLTPEGQLPR